MRHFKVRVCQICGREYQSTGSAQKFCIDCKTVARSARDKKSKELRRPEIEIQRKNYYALNRDQILLKQRTDCAEHPEKRSAQCVKNYANHSEAIKAKAREHYWVNPEKENARHRVYYAAHSEELREYEITYRKANPDMERKHVAKRRVLGFNALNSHFVGSEAHHINRNDVIYIPKELHRSVYHDQWTGKNMDKINVLACEWLARN